MKIMSKFMTCFIPLAIVCNILNMCYIKSNAHSSMLDIEMIIVKLRRE